VGLREHLPIGFGRAEFPEAERSRLFHDRLALLASRMTSSSTFDALSADVLAHTRRRPVTR